MAKKLKGLQMIVANRLDDGRAVFLSAEKGWTADTCAASVAEGDALDTLIARARKDVAQNLIAGFEAVEATLVSNKPLPSHGKPLMQSKGPSVRHDLGYQTGLLWEAS